MSKHKKLSLIWMTLVGLTSIYAQAPRKRVIDTNAVTVSFLVYQAQTYINVPPDARTISINTLPAAQAPEDALKNLSDLIHAGKYTAAQQSTADLLQAYPNDERLVKAKTLLDKLITPATSQGSGQPVQLTGMDNVKYNSLIELGREAQETTDLDQQKILFQQFIDKSRAFLQKHPEQILLWQVQAVSALSLGDPLIGYEAGEHLLTVGGANSTDANSQRLLSKLDLKDWLSKDRVIVRGRDFEIRFSEWYQAVTDASAKAQLQDQPGGGERQNISPQQPGLFLGILIFDHLMKKKSNDEDLASAMTNADAQIAETKVLWTNKYGAASNFDEYLKTFGASLGEYRSLKVNELLPYETARRLKLNLNDMSVANKLIKEAGEVQITDPDLNRKFRSQVMQQGQSQ